MSKREQAVRSSSANECPAGHLSEGISHSHQKQTPPCGVFFKTSGRFQALPGACGGRMLGYLILGWCMCN